MKAMIMAGYGGPENLVYTDIAPPVPGPGQVLVRVCAASVNPGNVKRASGRLRGVVPELTFPWVPGADFSGVVAAAGPGVDAFQPGDQVFGYAGPGGTYAEYVAVDAEAVAPKPRTLTHGEAASLALVAQTAAQALDAAGLEAGQTVLILGAGGAVGGVAVPLARARGARVLALARSRSVSRLRALGADEVIDGDTTPFEAVAQDVDAVIDGLGGDFERRAYTVLKPGGILVALTVPPAPDQAARAGVRAVFLRTQNRTGTLARLGRLLDDGQVKPFIGRTYPLRDAARAWRDYESGHVEGKIVIDIGDCPAQ